MPSHVHLPLPISVAICCTAILAAKESAERTSDLGALAAELQLESLVLQPGNGGEPNRGDFDCLLPLPRAARGASGASVPLLGPMHLLPLGRCGNAEVQTQAYTVRSLLCATLPCSRPRFGRVGYRGPERRQIADWSVDDGPMWGLCCQFCCEFPTPGQSLRVQAASTTYQGLQARHSYFFRNGCAGELSKDMLSRFLFLTGRLRSCGHEQQCLTLLSLGAGEVI